MLQLFVLRRLQGRLGELEAQLARYVDDYPELNVYRCALAALRCDIGHPDEARATSAPWRARASPIYPPARNGSSRRASSPRSART